MKANPLRRVEVPAGSPRGLYLVIHPTGKKSWAFRYRWGGRPTKLTFKHGYPEMSLAAARAEAEAALQDIRRGIDPVASKIEEERREPNSAEEVAKEWLARDVKPRTRTWSAVERIVNREILPICRNRLITEIGRPDVLRVIDSIVERGSPIAANETLSIAKRWLNWCVNRGYLEVSPVATVPAPSRKKTRDRVLSDDEVCKVWNAAGALGYPDAPFLRLLILTGQRRGEVAAMTWAELDLAKAVWTLSAERTKAGRIHDVPLPPPAIEILKALPRFEGPHVFTNASGVKPINSFSKCKVRLDAKILEARQSSGDAKIAAYTMHDLRRTASTHLAKIGVPPHVLSALLNHSPGSAQGVTAIYNRFRYLDERREALQKWSEHILAIAKPQRKERATAAKRARKARA